MAYMNADTSAKIGFRPYGQTEPYCAANLSGLPRDDYEGLGEYYLNRPFDPWELYPDVHHTGGMSGLGQNHPFKPQAWHLHGHDMRALAGLGDSGDPTAAAADELLAHGSITQAEHDAIIEGSMGFADVLGYDPTDQSSWMNLTNLFQEVNGDLQALEAAYASNAPPPGSAPNPTYAALGQQLIAQRQQYSGLASQFVRYYTLVMGSAPSGLSGLGLLPIIWVAGSAAFIVIAFIALYALRDWSKSIDVKSIAAQTQQAAATSTAATNQNLLQALAAAQAKGDTVTAQAILKTLQTTAAQPTAPGATEQWLMTNAKWLAIGAAALIAVGPISQGLFGGRRR